VAICERGALRQIAGAHYGVEAIPIHWLNRVSMRDLIAELANRLHGAAAG
jgi:ADP-ribosylglycohydrolase